MNKFKRIMELQEELQQEIMELQNELYSVQTIMKRTDIISNILSSAYFNKYDKNDPQIIEEYEIAEETYNMILEHIEHSCKTIDDLMSEGSL